MRKLLEVLIKGLIILLNIIIISVMIIVVVLGSILLDLINADTKFKSLKIVIDKIKEVRKMNKVEAS